MLRHFIRRFTPFRKYKLLADDAKELQGEELEESVRLYSFPGIDRQKIFAISIYRWKYNIGCERLGGSVGRTWRLAYL